MPVHAVMPTAGPAAVVRRERFPPGPRRYRGEVVRGPWIGNGRARATPADINRAGGNVDRSLDGLRLAGSIVDRLELIGRTQTGD